MKKILTTLCSLLLISCGGMLVRQQDLDAWVDAPVEALDTHSMFMSIPMYKYVTESGIEVRNYANGQDVQSCFTNAGGYSNTGYVNANAFTTCSSNRVVCNNIFYIKNGRVLEYAPTGQCYTNSKAQPEPRYLKLMQN